MKNTLIKDTTLSIRCINCLHAADIRTTNDLKAHIEKFGIFDFVKLRHFGYKSTEEINKFVTHNELMKNEVSEDDKKLAIDFHFWVTTYHYDNIESEEQVWDLFDKFIEQRNK